MPGFIVKTDIEKVRQMANLYDVISDDVALKQSGSSYMGLCPFHDEKTPSFSVNPSMGYWHCFGCGKSGDVFKYVMERDGVEFREAVEILADRYNFELHYEETGKDRPQQPKGSTRVRLLAVCSQAQKYFTSKLFSDEALPARQLLDGRKFTKADCEYFGCGYAPRGGDELVRHLASKGYTTQEMIDAGVARQGRSGAYDYFRGRVTWPIRDITGRVLGFGARKLYDDDKIEAKYINTPDTRLYHKNQVLYGLDLAKDEIRKTHQIVIVEGYTDVMACHLAGVKTAVATCGTAFGEEHAKIARRLIADNSADAIQFTSAARKGSRIVFTFDGDAAGQKAAIRAFSLDGRFLTQTFVAVAHDNLDPCDLRIKEGNEAVHHLVDGATPLYEFIVSSTIGRYDIDRPEGKLAAASALTPVLARIKDTALCRYYSREAAGLIGIDDSPRSVIRLQDFTNNVMTERKRLDVRDDGTFGTRDRRVFDEGRGGLTDAQRMAIMRDDAAQLRLRDEKYWPIDDTVFMTEQQLMAFVVQVPLAFEPTQFGNLASESFSTPLFRMMFEAVQSLGGLPDSADSITQSQWVTSIVNACGMGVREAVEQLATMPLPVDSETRDGDEMPGPDAPLRLPTEQEQRMAMQLLVGMLDISYAQKINEMRYRMRTLPEGSEKLELLARITKFEQQRHQIKDFVYNSNIA
ncbi:MAG: DNA primase [Bifidobacteriaceae bacterium]|nr:DNA primase [Bifidobacteriaceae bacterium]